MAQQLDYETRVGSSAPSPAKATPAFRLSFATGVLTSRLYPGVLQGIMGAVFVAVLLYGIFGPPMGEDNLAVVVTWRLWWLLLPFSFVLFGRLWCGVCPVGAASDVAQKLPLGRRRMPGAFLQRWGIWIAGALFLLLFWIGMVRHVCCFPRETAVVLLLFVGGAVAMGLTYRGRVWCRYLCPLGAYGGLFSMMGIVGLRSKREVCVNDCRVDKRQVVRAEMAQCPFFEVPTAMDTNRNCNLCGNCVKFCQRDALQLTVLAPGRELWKLRRPVTGEAFLALALLAFAFVEALQTTRLFPSYMKWALGKRLLGNYDLAFSLSILAALVVVIGSYILASQLSARMGGGEGEKSLANFGYGFLPLSLAGYLGVSLLRFSSHGLRAAQVAINQLSFSLAPFDLPPPVRGSFYEVDLPIKALQFAILALGTVGALYLMAKIAGKAGAGAPARALPHQVLGLAFSAILALSFVLPAGVILH